MSSPDAAAGGYGKVTFRVPERERHAPAPSRSAIQLPTKTPLASVRVQPVPGWTATTTKAPLNPPVKDDDGNTITEAVSVVEFDAAPGGGIAPGQFQEFSLSAGPFPKAASLTFTWSRLTATVARWPGSSRPSRARPSRSTRRRC